MTHRVAAITGAVAFVASTASAQESPEPTGPDLEISASFFSRYELRANFAALGLMGRRLGEADGVAYRARLGLATTPIDVGSGREVIVTFVPQASGFWGDVSGGLADAGLGVHEGKLRIRGDGYWVDAGRFEMAYGGHLVIGDVGWHETGRSFDGARARFLIGGDGAYLDGFATLIAEGSSVGASDPVGAGDVYFTGVYAGLGPLLDPALELDTYALSKVTPETDDGPMPQDFTALEVTLGTRMKRRLERVVASVELGVQLGKRAPDNDRVIAYQIDMEALADVIGALRLGGGASWASGDDPDTGNDESYDQLFPTAHKFLGMMDIIGPRSNVAAAALKARHAIARFKLAADAHLFWRPEVAPGVDHYAGFETDIWGAWLLGKGLALRAQYSLFAPSSSGPFATGEVAHYVELQLGFKR